jgi:hypothetical protein
MTAIGTPATGRREVTHAQGFSGVLPKLGDNDKVTFSDLVLAHHFRQTAIYRGAKSDASHDDRTHAQLADAAYRERRERFEDEHGAIVRAYWCTHEISAVAVTEKYERLPWWRGWRMEKRERFYSATDWATRDCPPLKHQLHKIDNLGVRADEILRGTPEYIAMQLLLTASSHVLSYVDRTTPPRDRTKIRQVVDSSDAEIAEIKRYYLRAGENASRIVYAGGMLRGALLLGLLITIAGLVMWAAGTFDHHDDYVTSWTVLATIAAGGIGASVSVLLRMSKENFSQDFEVGRPSVRRLAMARPFVGAAFAIMIYLLLRSGLVTIGEIDTKSLTFYVAVGFLAGFSERWARVIISGVTGDEVDDKDERGSSSRDAPQEPDFKALSEYFEVKLATESRQRGQPQGSNPSGG